MKKRKEGRDGRKEERDEKGRGEDVYLDRKSLGILRMEPYANKIENEENKVNAVVRR